MIKTKTSSRHESQGVPIAGIEVTKLVREFVPVISTPDGGTIGQIIDHMLIDMVHDGQEMHSVTVHMEGTQWATFRDSIVGQRSADAAEYD